MQERHTNRELYFKELAFTSETFFVPYVQHYHVIKPGQSVLEIGCGEGGNLLPFAEMGCAVTGVDIARCRIEEAQRFFEQRHASGNFIAEDIFNIKNLEHKFDIIICHDVIEHISDKSSFLARIGNYLQDDGVIFMSFPAWPMPFGGHQQICRSRLCSHAPFIHLLPTFLYKTVLNVFGESNGCVRELLSIKQTRITIERFEKLVVNNTNLYIRDRQLYLISPHYKIKFGWRPIKLPVAISFMPFIRNVFSTTCFYIISRKDYSHAFVDTHFVL